MTETTSTTATPRTTAGASLVPDLKKLTKGVIGKHWYWIGALPGCPREHLDIGSTNFPKMTEDVRRDSRGQTHRRPQIGSIRQLTQVQLQRIQDDLPQCVIRFDTDGPNPGGPGDGLEVLDKDRRKGEPMRIPTDKQVEEAKKRDRFVDSYSASVLDEPAARYVFAQLCENQERPQRSDFFPEPLEVTGLEWPGPKE